MYSIESFGKTFEVLFVIFIFFIIIYVIYLIFSWYYLNVQYMETNEIYMRSISKSLDKIANDCTDVIVN